MNITETSQVVPPKASGHNPLINRNFALLWSGQTISMLGDFVFNTTLIVWVAIVLTRGQAWTTLAVSGVALASSLPNLLLGPAAGVFVDRWNKRLALLWSNFLPAVCIALLLLVVNVSGQKIGLSWELGLLYLTAFLVSVCAQIARPAWLALTRQIVAQEKQSQAIGLDQASNSLAMLIGPALAPPLLLAFGPQWALLIDILSFLICTFTILFIRVPRNELQTTRTERGSFLAEFQEGLRFLSKNQLLRTILIASSIAWLGGGVLSALDVFFVTQNLHTAPALYGVLDTALGCGTILGALGMAILGERLSLTRIFWVSLLLLGAGILVYARLSSFVPALVVVFGLGIPFALLSVATGPLLLRATPETLLGRVSSLFNPSSTLATLLGSAVAGILASALYGHFALKWANMTFEPVDTILMGAGLLLLIGGLYAMLGLRRADNRPAQTDERQSQEQSRKE